MTLQYYDLKPKVIELAHMTDDDINIGVKSTPLKITPSFIMPDNSIYYMTTDHYSANFFEELEMSLDIIGRGSTRSLEEHNPKEKLIFLRNKLMKDYQKFFVSNISAGDVRNYLNMNCLEIFKYNPNLKNVYSLDCKSVLLMLLSSKIQIYNYFIKLLDDRVDIIKSLKEYPIFSDKNINYKKVLENAKNMLNVSDNQEDKMILRKIICNLIDLSKNELNNLISESFMQDFAVISIGIDKIETQVKNTITTTKQNSNEFYFNYLIMGYNIIQLPKVIFDKETQSFIKSDINEYSFISHYDEKYKKEAELIKKRVPYRERYKYFI